MEKSMPKRSTSNANLDTKRGNLEPLTLESPSSSSSGASTPLIAAPPSSPRSKATDAALTACWQGLQSNVHTTQRVMSDMTLAFTNMTGENKELIQANAALKA